MDTQKPEMESDVSEKSELYPFYIICDLVFGMRFTLAFASAHSLVSFECKEKPLNKANLAL